MSLSPAPIALFVFHRPRHTRRTLEALARNTSAKSSRSIREGVDAMLARWDRVIVLEDDLPDH